MMNDRETMLPIQRARDVLHFQRIDQFPLVVKEILPSLGIEYAEEYIEVASFDGCAIKEGGIKGVLVNAGIPYPARRNFTCAHELGHCLIETHN